MKTAHSISISYTANELHTFTAERSALIAAHIEHALDLTTRALAKQDNALSSDELLKVANTMLGTTKIENLATDANPSLISVDTFFKVLQITGRLEPFYINATHALTNYRLVETPVRLNILVPTENDAEEMLNNSLTLIESFNPQNPESFWLNSDEAKSRRATIASFIGASLSSFVKESLSTKLGHHCSTREFSSMLPIFSESYTKIGVSTPTVTRFFNGALNVNTHVLLASLQAVSATFNDLPEPA